jgi:hypothetical protein
MQWIEVLVDIAAFGGFICLATLWPQDGRRTDR